MKRLRLLQICLLAMIASSADALVVDVPITLLPATSDANRLNLSATAEGFSDSDSSDLAGTVAAQLQLDFGPEGTAATGIRFNGGDITATDVDFEFVFIVPVATVAGRDLVADLSTPGGLFSPISGGMFPTQNHQLTLYQGTLTGTGLASSLQIDLSTEPLAFTDDQPSTIEIIESNLGNGLLGYTVNLTLPIDAVEDVSSDTIAASVTATGTVSASGTFQLQFPAGDFDLNGSVDASDYTTWRDAYSSGAATVDDYLDWRASFGGSPIQVPTASSVTSTPEPSSGLLGVLIFALHSCRRRADWANLAKPAAPKQRS